MKKTFKTILSVSLFTILSLAAAHADPQWEKTGEDDGITTFRKEIPNSPIVAFRGEAVINAPIAKVANIIIDTAHKKEWVANVLEAKNIREINAMERVEYNKSATPWPVKDRDFVFAGKLSVDTAKQSLRFDIHSVVDPLAPETKSVRGEIKSGTYILTSLENGAKTKLEVEIAADPKGAIPKWVANMVQKKWPRKTITGIRIRATKPEVVENAGMKALLQGMTEAQSVAANEIQSKGKSADEAIAEVKNQAVAAEAAAKEAAAKLAAEEASKNKKVKKAKK